ncbi:MAG TPA: hypothetical protein VLI55_00240 [Bryobacteraceae bacterium]|nr:hypothetical protein [Bryobacteraceae bacterium]
MFNGPAKAVPIGQRNAIQNPWAGFTQIQQHHAESASMQQQVGRAYGMLRVPTAAYPKQVIELNSSGSG